MDIFTFVGLVITILFTPKVLQEMERQGRKEKLERKASGKTSYKAAVDFPLPEIKIKERR